MELHSEKEDRRPDNIWIGGMGQRGHGLRKGQWGNLLRPLGSVCRNSRRGNETFASAVLGANRSRSDLEECVSTLQQMQLFSGVGRGSGGSRSADTQSEKEPDSHRPLGCVTFSTNFSQRHLPAIEPRDHDTTHREEE